MNPAQLRAVVLCCGAYYPSLVDHRSGLGALWKAILWSYSGTRHYPNDPYFATMNVTTNLTAAFPPAFLTAGNGDFLLEHSRELAATLKSAGAELDTLFYSADHHPRLGHEYQFELDLDDAQTSLTRLTSFLQQHTR